MRLVVRNLDEALNFEEGKVLTLLIQNRHFFREILSELARSQVEKTDGQTLVFDDGEDVGSRVIAVGDVLGFDFSSRRIQAELYKHIAENIDNDTIKLLGDLETELEKIVIFAEEAADMELDHRADFAITDWLRFLKIEPVVGGSYDFKSRIFGIIDIVSRLFPEKIICFVNLKQLLTHTEFTEVTKYCLYKKQLVWFLESTDSYVSEFEKIVVVDDDLFCSKKRSGTL